MIAFSKVAMEFLKTAECSDVAHSKSCTFNAFYQLYRFFISNAKYYAPLIALPAIARIRTLNRKSVEDLLHYYLECIGTGTAVGWTISSFICVFRNLLGEFKYYSFLFLPTLIGALNICWATPRVQRLHILSILQSTVETILMRRQNFLTKAIASSLLLQTILFMSSSSIILQAKQAGIYKGFWLLTPDPVSSNACSTNDVQQNKETIPDEEHEKLCSHKEKNCFQHFTKGVRSYFAFGITLDVLKALIVPKENVGGFWSKLFAKLRNLQFNSAALLSSYIGIYRLTYCYLNRTTRNNSSLSSVNHLAAGFLSGICYIFMPKLTWLSYALVLTVQILWNLLITQQNHVNSDQNKIWMAITRLHYGKIFYAVSLAYLVHAYALHSSRPSNLAQSIIDNTTDFYAQNILSRLRNLDNFLTSSQ